MPPVVLTAVNFEFGVKNKGLCALNDTKKEYINFMLELSIIYAYIVKIHKPN